MSRSYSQLSLKILLIVQIKILFYSVCFAEIPIEEIKAISTNFHKKYQHLSPLTGIASSKIVKNIYNFGPSLKKDNQEELLISLVHSLFHQINSQEFVPTNHPLLPAYYLDPYLMGKMRGLIEQKDIKGKGKKYLDEILPEINKELWQELLLQEKIQQQKKITTDLIKKLLSLSNAKDANSERAREILIKDLKKFIPNLNQDNYQEILVKADELISNIFDKKLKDDFQKLIRKIILYQHSPHYLGVDQVLNAFLWMKAQTKNDFLSYYQGLFEKKADIFVDPTIITDAEKQKIWLSEKFKLEDINLEPYSGNYPQQQTTKLKNNDQNLLELQYYYLLANSSKHAPLQMQKTSLVGNQSFTDCGETMLRNFFKIILFDGAKYDTTILEKIGIDQSESISPELQQLIDYFKKYSTISDQTTIEARNKWAELMSNHQKVKYRKGLLNTEDIKCELDAGAGNAINLINKLFAFKLPLNWPDFFNLIAQATNNKITLNEIELDDYQNKNNEQNFGTITFHSKLEGSFNLHFDSYHFYIVPISENNYLLNQISRDLLIESLTNKKMNLQMMMTPSTKEKVEMLVQADMDSKSSQTKYRYLYYNHFNDDKNLLYLHKNMMKEVKKKKENAGKMLEIYPLDFCQKIFELLITNESKAKFIGQLVTPYQEPFLGEIDLMIKEPSTYHDLARYILSQNEWTNTPDRKEWAEQMIDQIIEDSHAQKELTKHVLSKTDWRTNNKMPSWIDQLVKTAVADEEIIENILTDASWHDHEKFPSWIETILARGNTDSVVAQFILPGMKKEQKNLKIKWIDHLIKRGQADSSLINYVFRKLIDLDTQKTNEWVNQLLSKSENHNEMARRFFNSPLSTNHPQSSIWIDYLISLNNKKTDEVLIKYVFPAPFWRNQPLANDWMKKLISRNHNHHSIIGYILSKDFWIDHPDTIKWVEFFLQNEKNHGPLAYSFLAKDHGMKFPEIIKWVEQILKIGAIDERSFSRAFLQSPWKNHPHLLKLLEGKPFTLINLQNALKDRDLAQLAQKEKTENSLPALEQSFEQIEKMLLPPRSHPDCSPPLQ